MKPFEKAAAAVTCLQKHSIIDIWQGSEYASAASFFIVFHFFRLYIWMDIWKIRFPSENVKLLWSSDVN